MNSNLETTLKDKTAESLLARILNAKTDLAVFGFKKVDMESITEMSLKSSFRQIALLIHPDKCKLRMANDGFKRLKSAYDGLILLISYSLKSSTSHQQQSQHNEKPCKDSESSSSMNGSSSSAPTQSIDEVLQEMQEEEKVFNDENITTWAKYYNKKQRLASKFNHVQSEEEIEEKLNSDHAAVEERATAWKIFIAPESAKKSTPTASGNDIKVPPTPTSQVLDSPAICELCQRLFRSPQQLSRHVLQSQMHKDNVSKLSAVI